MATKTKPAKGIPSRLDSRRRAALEASNEAYGAKQVEIVQAAARLFTEQGYDATSLSDIADAVSIDRATLYYYFKSKPHLLAFAMTNVFSPAVKEMNAVVASDDDALTKLRGAVRCMLTAMIEKHPYSALYFQDDIWRTPTHAALIASQRKDHARIAKIFTKIVEEGQRDGTIRDDVPAELVTRIVFGSTAWSYRWLKPGAGYTAESVLSSFDAILSDGVAPIKKPGAKKRSAR